jgi:hypothetical protein
LTQVDSYISDVRGQEVLQLQEQAAITSSNIDDREITHRRSLLFSCDSFGEDAGKLSIYMHRCPELISSPVSAIKAGRTELTSGPRAGPCCSRCGLLIGHDSTVVPVT